MDSRIKSAALLVVVGVLLGAALAATGADSNPFHDSGPEKHQTVGDLFSALNMDGKNGATAYCVQVIRDTKGNIRGYQTWHIYDRPRLCEAPPRERAEWYEGHSPTSGDGK